MNHNVKLARHILNLVRPCPMTDCYFQQCTLIFSLVLFHYFQVGKAWLRDLPEDLDMFIAQRDFERAMELVDRSELVVIPIQ